MYKKITCFLFFLILSVAVFSQTGVSRKIKFNHLGSEEGLSQSTINAITQDKKGFMWFGTEDGLNMFDGSSFRVFKHDPLNKNSLDPNMILCLAAGKNEKIWIGFDYGCLNSYDPLTKKFTSYKDQLNKFCSAQNVQINSIYIDTTDILWLGTDQGLIKFDPQNGNLKQFKVDSINKRSISSNDIFAVSADKKGIIWLGASNGLNKFDAAKEIFSNYKNDPSFSIKEKIQCLLVDKDQNIWAGTEDKGVCRFFTGTHAVTWFRNDEKNIHTLSSSNITSLAQDKTGNIWVGTADKGLCGMNYQQGGVERYFHNDNNITSLKYDQIKSIYCENGGVIFIGNNSVDYFHPLAEKFNVYGNDPENPKKSLKDEIIFCLTEDENGTIWAGSDHSGVYAINSATKNFTQFQKGENKNNSLLSNGPMGLANDKHGTIWIGTYEGGLNSIDTKTLKLRSCPLLPEYPDSTYRVEEVFVDSKGMIWNGGGDEGLGLVVLDPKNISTKRYLNDPKNETSLSNNYVITINEDETGKFWIGTAQGLNYFDPATGRFKRYLHADNDSTTIKNDYIYSIYLDSDGLIWLGTGGAGLTVLNPKTEKFISYTEHDGLPNNIVYAVLPDGKGKLWLSTNKGICRFTPVKNPFSKKDKPLLKNYDIKDGLPSEEFNQGAYCKSENGHILFGGIKGIVRFHPDSLWENNYLPPIYITSFKVFGKEFPLDTVIINKRSIALNYDQNFLSFDYTALNYLFPEKNQYSVMMEGVDKDWNYVGSRKFASYTSVPPGEYILKIKASNNDGVWNEKGIILRITITPPFWRTWWFYLLVTASTITLILLYIKKRERELKKQQMVLEGLVEVRTFELKKEKVKVEEAHGELEKTHKKIELAHENIKASIRYAKNIQDALLPSEQILNKLFPDHFILFKPKDIVSGDFYWAHEKNNRVIIAAVDCTGHGVPGAFMSLLGINLLNQVIAETDAASASIILEKLSNLLISTLNQTNDDASIKDGMDIALIVIDKQKNELHYSGAHNSMYFIRDDIFTIFNADKRPAGFAKYGKDIPFTDHKTKIKKGDLFYIFTDGFVDQKGGLKNKKFFYAPFEELLNSIHHLEMKEQQQKLNQTITEWKGTGSQMDDIMIIGVRI